MCDRMEKELYRRHLQVTNVVRSFCLLARSLKVFKSTMTGLVSQTHIGVREAASIAAMQKYTRRQMQFIDDTTITKFGRRQHLSSWNGLERY